MPFQPPPPPPRPPADASTDWDAGALRPAGAGETGPGDEVVLFSAVPAAMPSVWLRWLITLGLYEIWRRRTKFIVTNRRVVWRTGLINRSERSIPISRIQDVTTHKGVLSGWVELSSAGGTTGVETMGPVWNASVDRMAQAIDSLLR